MVLTNRTTIEKQSTTKEDAKELKANFSLLFNNEIPEKAKDKIYIYQNIENEALNRYKINVKIPMLRIKDDVAKTINSEITNTFVKKILSIMQNKENPFTIYNIDFFTTLNEEILTIAIKCDLKEGKNAQRTIIKTYNYDLEEKKLLTLSDIIKNRGLEENAVQEMIFDEIEKAIKKEETIQIEGYNAFNRAINDVMYNIDNTKEFMLDSNNNLYIIYPYGNMNITSQKDLIVIPK